jgi:dihydroceramidase
MLYAAFATLYIVLEHNHTGDDLRRSRTDVATAAAAPTVGDGATITSVSLCPRLPQGKALAYGLLAWSAFVTALVVGFQGLAQLALFHLSFATAELFSLWRMYCIFAARKRRVRSPNHEDQARCNTHDAAAGCAASVASDGGLAVFKMGMGSYLLGLLVWQTDLRQCEFMALRVPQIIGFNPQLHAWWHVFVSLGFYCLIVFAAYDRADLQSIATSAGACGRVAPTIGWACGGICPYLKQLAKNGID